MLAVAVLLPLFVWEQASGQTVVWNRESLLGLAYIGIFPSVAAYLLYSFAVARVGAVKAGLSIHLMPVFGVLLSVGLLGETFQTYHALGIGLIAAGLVLCHRADWVSVACISRVCAYSTHALFESPTAACVAMPHTLHISKGRLKNIMNFSDGLLFIIEHHY